MTNTKDGADQPRWPYKEWNRQLEADKRLRGVGSNAQLASLAGIDRSGFSRYATGAVQPTPEQCIRIADALEVSPLPYLVYSGRIRQEHLNAPLIAPVYQQLLDNDERAGRIAPAEQDSLRGHVAVLNTATTQRLDAIERPDTNGESSRHTG